MGLTVNGIWVPDGEVATGIKYAVTQDGSKLTIDGSVVVGPVTLPGWGPTTPPVPPEDLGELIFDDVFGDLVDLQGFNTKQVTGGGRDPVLRDVTGLGRVLECWAPEGGKSEIGHVIPQPMLLGDEATLDQIYCVRQGRAQFFKEDFESSRAAGGGESEPGPRNRWEPFTIDGASKLGEGIEQDKFGGQNVRPTKFPVEPLKWYERRWKFRYGRTDGWQEVWMKERGSQNPFILTTKGSNLATGPGTPLDRVRYGVTAAGSGAGTCIIWIARQTLWIKRA